MCEVCFEKYFENLAFTFCYNPLFGDVYKKVSLDVFEKSLEIVLSVFLKIP